jgi:hypothetical protein
VWVLSVAEDRFGERLRELQIPPLYFTPVENISTKGSRNRRSLGFARDDKEGVALWFGLVAGGVNYCRDVGHPEVVRRDRD